MSYVGLARETTRFLKELINRRILTEEDMLEINKIFINRIEKLEAEVAE